MKNFYCYRQLDQMDCGPTCLRMVAKHYGRLFTAQSLREKAQIGKEGVSMLGISEAAEAIGFRTIGARISFEKLTTEAPLPCIVHWDQNHFVVVYGTKGTANSWMSRAVGGRKPPESAGVGNQPKTFGDSFTVDQEQNVISSSVWQDGLPPITTGGRAGASTRRGVIFVADPSKGLVSYTADEFCQHWLSTQTGGKEEGIVLLLEPTPQFFEQEDEVLTSYGFNRMFAYLWQYKQLLVQLVLGLVVGSGLQLLFPFLTQSVVDVGINTQNLSFVYLVLGAQLMLMTGRLSVDFIRSWILLHISTRVNLSILSDFLIKLMRLPVSFFDSKRFGDLMQRINDHHRIESFLTSQTISILFSLLNLFTFGVVLFLYNLTIFGVFVISSAFYLGWVLLFLRQRRKLDFKRFDVAAKSQDSLVQLITGMQDIKLAGAERPMRWAWERLQTRLFKLQMRGLALNQYQQVGAFGINESKNIIITFLAARAVVTGQMTLGSMLAVQYIIGQLNSPIEQLIAFVQGFQDAKISLERLNEIHMLEDEELVIDSLSHLSSSIRIPVDKGLLLNNVSFTYVGAGNEPVLHALSLTIPAGKTTAIVGTSGSGKTTLLKLLLRFYEPTAGEIRLGDVSSTLTSKVAPEKTHQDFSTTPLWNWDGVRLSNIGHSLWRKQCGVVMQDGFIFSDTIARNIAVGVERIDGQRLDHAVRIANLREFIDSLPLGLHTKIGAEGNGISQGQRQRILIARAVYKDPQFIFLDEATNALDTTNEAVIMHNLTEFFTGRTVIVVAHRLSTVVHADQIIVLSRGRVTEIGTHAELAAQRGDYWQLVKNQLELGL